jgi:AcrR family transcriptional regulator
MTATTPLADPPRRPGRPRSVKADEAILQAAIDTFVDRGWDGLTIEGVAARAGVGKSTIYRRYPCRVDLLVAAARRLAEERDPVPDTGSLRADLTELVTSFVRMLTTTRTGQAIPLMVAATAKDPELAAPYREFLAERRASWRVPIDRAITRGELPLEVDPGLLVDLLVGPLFYRGCVSHEPSDAAYVDALVAAALRAVA